MKKTKQIDINKAIELVTKNFPTLPKESATTLAKIIKQTLQNNI
jgi:hypothetical protein